MDSMDIDADLSTVIIEEAESEDSRKSAASDPPAQQQESQLKKKPLNPEAEPKPDEALELTQLSNSNSATDTPGQPTGPHPELDIVINNVVCSFSVRCHLKLREIALKGANVEYRRENGMVTMKLRHPYTTASIWSSGRITCTGATSEALAKVAARRYARYLGKLGFPTRFQNFRIVNVLGTCSMPWAIKIVNFSERHRENASYEPELHPGVTYKILDPKATLKIFSTGSITVTAASVKNVEAAIQHIYPIVFEFRKQRSAEEWLHIRSKRRHFVGADPSELEELIMNENKVPGDNNIVVNTQPDHGKSETAASATAQSTSSINSVQRLKQFESYVHVDTQTQDGRRHIPFHDDSSDKSSPTAAGTASSSSSGENICANARRRATEYWASKLENKRTRYNIASPEPATSSSGITVVANAKPGNATGTSGKNPVSQVLKQSSSRARNTQQQQELEQQQLIQVVQCPKVRSSPAVEPADFDIDDLIEEEEESNEFGLLY
ncbi:hypothetical protein KR026_002353 [Drosophila bipectinata]|nr:hypothetical protein KR026_002353 [Drosophila bipectinata]